MDTDILLELLERINVLEERVAKLTITLEEQEKPPSNIPIAVLDVHENDNETIINIEDDERMSLYQKWLYDE